MKDKSKDHSKYQNWIDPNQTKPYEKNAKMHPEGQVKDIATSIKKYGWQQDVVLTKDNVVVIGHGRRLAAIKLGCEMPYHIVNKNADELTEKEIRELRIADNKLNESGWLEEILKEEVTDLDFDGFGFSFDFVDGTCSSTSGDEDEDLGENKYSKKVKIPHYEPTGDEPEISDLFDMGKASELIEEIEDADVPEETKEFLRFAAYRHIVFNYKNIAEFYAHQDADVQRLMEKSALVIIDIDDAIANGYVKLTKTIQDIIEGDDDDEE